MVGAPRGITLLVLILTFSLACQYGREIFREEGPPAFFVEKSYGIKVLLGKGFSRPGVHQISDGQAPRDVIEMAGLEISPTLGGGRILDLPLLHGESLAISLRGAEVVEMKREWMSCGQRIALGIVLHPDRMSLDDWQGLPGIGPRLAERIEKDRQKNGDFGSFAALERVSGIGPGRMEELRVFFH